jgi:hypothetical protein
MPILIARSKPYKYILRVIGIPGCRITVNSRLRNDLRHLIGLIGLRLP